MDETPGRPSRRLPRRRLPARHPWSQIRTTENATSPARRRARWDGLRRFERRSTATTEVSANGPQRTHTPSLRRSRSWLRHAPDLARDRARHRPDRVDQNAAPRPRRGRYSAKRHNAAISATSTTSAMSTQPIALRRGALERAAADVTVARVVGMFAVEPGAEADGPRGARLAYGADQGTGPSEIKVPSRLADALPRPGGDAGSNASVAALSSSSERPTRIVVLGTHAVDG
jgi:hypothetical protein